MKTAIVVGSGFAGLSAAAHLAKEGVKVTVLEKNEQFGGRNRQFEAEGFKFDMGPSWYWMPEVFEGFFNKFGKSTSDYFELTKLNPSFSIYMEDGNKVDIPSEVDELRDFFEKTEKGAGKKYEKFMASAKYKYDLGMSKLVYKPGKKISELIDWEVISGVFKLSVFESFHKYVRKYFKHPYLTSLMDFPVLFLGNSPKNTPALYSLMNYAGLELGTWYPQGGMHEIMKAMVSLIEEMGVEVITNAEVEAINITNGKASSVTFNDKTLEADMVVAAGDYKHMETLLDPTYRNYKDEYWDTRTFSPSSLLFYVGLDKKLEGIDHHTLFFDESLEKHAEEIYNRPQWPSKPLFYTCCPSKTDASVAPQGKENLFMLIPLAPGLEDNDDLREYYFDVIVRRLEKLTNQKVKEHIVYKRSYCLSDFEKDYYAAKGNAYGLANTINQTANLKPKMHYKKVSNLVYAGQLTIPGPGMPPAIVSGEVAANELLKVV